MNIKTLAILTFASLALSLGAQSSALSDKKAINRILQDPDLAGYAITCRADDGSYNPLQINGAASSIDCPKGSNRPLNIEVINAQIVAPPPIGNQFKAAAEFFETKDYFVYQCNQLLLDGKSYLLFYYYPSKQNREEQMILFK